VGLESKSKVSTEDITAVIRAILRLRKIRKPGAS